MKLDLTCTLLELGDATSRNLEFSHRNDVWVSYGEETITETNLLEIARRNHEHVRIRTFPKRFEAVNGSDWEWHIVGSKWTLRLRVRAKRLQCNGVLRIKHTVKSSGREQRDLLISGAEAEGMKPVYCIYCTEPQRNVWNQMQTDAGFSSFQTGCLIADAGDVPGTTAKLDEIEEECRPWHHLLAPEVQMQKAQESFSFDGEDYVPFSFLWQPRMILVADHETVEKGDELGRTAPTIDDLNGDTEREFDRTGVRNTTSEDLARLESGTSAGSEVAKLDGERLREQGIRRMMVMDVREERESDERLGR